MVTEAAFRKMALALPDVTEEPHFEKPSFRRKGKIFATYHRGDNKAMLKLTPVLQAVYAAYGPDVYLPVPGYWGRQGATFVLLALADETVFAEALQAAWEGVGTKKKGKQ